MMEREETAAVMLSCAMLKDVLCVSVSVLRVCGGGGVCIDLLVVLP